NNLVQAEGKGEGAGEGEGREPNQGGPGGMDSEAKPGLGSDTVRATKRSGHKGGGPIHGTPKKQRVQGGVWPKGVITSTTSKPSSPSHASPSPPFRPPSPSPPPGAGAGNEEEQKDKGGNQGEERRGRIKLARAAHSKDMSFLPTSLASPPRPPAAAPTSTSTLTTPAVPKGESDVTSSKGWLSSAGAAEAEDRGQGDAREQGHLGTGMESGSEAAARERRRAEALHQACCLRERVRLITPRAPALGTDRSGREFYAFRGERGAVYAVEPP
ncbi:unnamed protein product, partial [Discosporangium mesarthrocarpum]